MKKKIVITVIAVIVAVLIVIGFLKYIQLTMEEDRIYIGNSIVIPYSYSIYKDHIVLEKYLGDEKEVIIPQTIWNKPVTVIGRKCFWNCEEIESVILNENIEVLGVCAFESCGSLRSVTGGVNVKQIEGSAFAYCKKLEQADLGDNLEILEYAVFDMCYKLKKFATQDKLTYIGYWCFYDAGLEEFEFSKEVEVEYGAFSKTPWLKNQKEEFIIYGDGALVYYNGTDEKVVIPDGVKCILGRGFEESTAKEVYVSDTVTRIESFTFLDCVNPVRVYIPDSVTDFDEDENKNRLYPPTIYDDTDLTIVTTKNSPAHKYAKRYNIPYEIVEGW